MALTYDQFLNKIRKKTTFYKFLNDRKLHSGFQYKLGLNVDTIKFNPSGSCEPGGLYFSDNENIAKFTIFGNNIACITLLEDAQFYIDPEGDKYKTDKFYIEAIIYDFDSLLYYTQSMTLIQASFQHPSRRSYRSAGPDDCQ